MTIVSRNVCYPCIWQCAPTSVHVNRTSFLTSLQGPFGPCTVTLEKRQPYTLVYKKVYNTTHTYRSTQKPHERRQERKDKDKKAIHHKRRNQCQQVGYPGKQTHHTSIGANRDEVEGVDRLTTSLRTVDRVSIAGEDFILGY